MHAGRQKYANVPDKLGWKLVQKSSDPAAGAIEIPDCSKCFSYFTNPEFTKQVLRRKTDKEAYDYAHEKVEDYHARSHSRETRPDIPKGKASDS